MAAKTPLALVSPQKELSISINISFVLLINCISLSMLSLVL